MVNKALSDENVSEEEFRKMNNERNDYESKRNEILKVPKKGGTLRRSQSMRELSEELLKLLRQLKTS